MLPRFLTSPNCSNRSNSLTLPFRSAWWMFNSRSWNKPVVVVFACNTVLPLVVGGQVGVQSLCALEPPRRKSWHPSAVFGASGPHFRRRKTLASAARSHVSMDRAKVLSEVPAYPEPFQEPGVRDVENPNTGEDQPRKSKNAHFCTLSNAPVIPAIMRWRCRIVQYLRIEVLCC